MPKTFPFRAIPQKGELADLLFEFSLDKFVVSCELNIVNSASAPSAIVAEEMFNIFISFVQKSSDNFASESDGITCFIAAILVSI